MSVRLPPRWARRALAPVVLAAEAALLVVVAAGAVVGAVVAPFDRRRRLLRVFAFASGYLCVEVAAYVAAGALWLRWSWARRPGGGRRHPPPAGWAEAHRRLLGWALGAILAWGGRCAGFRLVLDQPDRRGRALDDDRPVLVMARHAGPGDSFALVHLLLERYHRGVRIVLKEVLQADPALDVLLNRLGCCFLPATRTDDDDLAGRLAGLAGDLLGRDTLLVFPEGGNWTPGRRRRAIRRLRRDGKSGAADAATLMSHVLPPRPAGVLAVLAARPDLPVILVAHAGLDRIVSAGQVWRALPFTTPMTVRAWPASPFPQHGDEEARLAWLTAEWAVVDEWVDAHDSRPALGA